MRLFVFEKDTRVLGQQDFAKSYLILDEEQTLSVISAGQNLGQIFDDAKLPVYPEDIVSAFPDLSYGLGSQINIKRATPVVVSDAGISTLYHTWTTNVTDFIAEKNITLAETDLITPSQSADLEKNLQITITRIKNGIEIENEKIDFQKITKQDPTIYIGQTKITQKGVEGIRELSYKVTVKNGVFDSKVKIGDKITKNPVTQIENIGTKKQVTVRCGGFDKTVEDAAAKYGIDPNPVCVLMIKESNGHINSVNPAGPYRGLFQYSDNFWLIASKGAGYAGASWQDATAQIYATCWAFSHGYRGRWP